MIDQNFIELVYLNNLSKQSKKVLKAGQIFGEKNFFTGIPNDVCIISKEFTQILKIEREEFRSIIKEKEKDFQEFCQIRDELSLYNRNDKINHTCKICDQINHNTNDCQFVHFNKAINYKKLGYNCQSEQNRKDFMRKRLFKEKIFVMKSIEQQDQIYILAQSLREINNQNSESSSNSYEDDLTQQSKLNDNVSFSSQEYNIKQVASKQFSKQFDCEQSPSNINAGSSLNNNNIYYEDRNQKKIIKLSLQNFTDQLDSSLINENLKNSSKIVQHNARRDLSEITKKESSKLIRQLDIHINSNQDILERNKNSTFSLAIENEQTQSINSQCENKRRDKNILGKLDDLQIIKTQQLINEQISLMQNQQKYLLQGRKSGMNKEIPQFQLKSPQSICLFTNNLIEDDFELVLFNPWLFESLKDYKYYFPYGNSYNFFKRYNRTKRKQQRQIRKSFRK